MRRRCGFIIVSVILCLSLLPFAPAEASDKAGAHGPGSLAEGGGGLLRLRPGGALEIRADGFGGYLYSYVDEQGHKHITNRIDQVPERFRARGEWAAVSGSGTSLRVKPDGFGGLLYCYMDPDGYKHTTNSLHHVPPAFHAAVSGGTFFAVTCNQGRAERVPLMLAGSDTAVGSDAVSLKPPEAKPMPDPLEPLNRVIFAFNDRLYFWIVKPLATGYQKLVPEPLRVCVRNFFSNLATPIRAVNCLLQGKVKAFGTELARFVLNTTLGILGFADPAKEVFEIEKKDEDLGQTMGFHGVGPGFYIDWPILGPSSLRDTVGSIGDGFLDPAYYLVGPTRYKAALEGYREINETSLRIGEYEDLKESALDPYVALKDAYQQYRRDKIRR